MRTAVAAARRREPGRIDKRALLLIGAVILIATLIFLLRNTAFFKMPNFFVEDATVLFNNVLTRNPVRAVLLRFNGYLIVGQYVLAYISVGLNYAFGGGLETLPVVAAVVSCLFLGVTASLPFLLFRKELGGWLSFLTVILTALVPMYSYDYAIIGSLSNLKFVFFYIAFMFVLYRLKRGHKWWHYALIDSVLLLCVLTNASVAFLTPLALLPYIKEWRLYLKPRLQERFIPGLSALALVAVSGLYVAVVLLKGVTPSVPGYMAEPFAAKALLPILERTVFYAWTYPITSIFNSYFVAGLLLAAGVGLGLLFKRQKRERAFLVCAVWSLVVATALLIQSRPGISLYYTSYGHKGGPDQFFIAQNMIVLFASAWLLRGVVRRASFARRAGMLTALALYLTLAIPYGTSFGGSAIVYKGMGTIRQNLAKACNEYAYQKQVIIQVYPTPYWQWHIDRSKACR